MKRFKSLSIAVFLVLGGFLVLSVGAHAQEKVIKLRYANFLPPVHKASVLSEEWCKEVEKRTNGRVNVAYFPGGTLVPANQAYESTVKGIADIAITCPSWVAGRFPLSEVLELPLGYNNAVQATAMANAWFKKFKPKEYDDVKVFYFWGAGPGMIMTTKPVSSISGLKGLKIRAGGNQSKIVAALGATPVSVPNPDIYEGLQRGVIDGLLFYPESLKGWKYGDVIKGLQDNPAIGCAGTGVYVMNKRKWDSLPADIQAIIEQINEEWAVKIGALWREYDREGREFGVSKGMKILTISPDEAKISVEKMKPLFDEYANDMQSKNLPGRDSLKFCLDYLKANH